MNPTHQIIFKKFFYFNSRTLTAVHEAILEDLVYPAEIVGKRIRIRLDGTRLIKVHLDKAQQTNIEHKVWESSFSMEGFGILNVMRIKSILEMFPMFVSFVIFKVV